MESVQTRFPLAYRELKARHPNALLLFKCGDFYEVLGDDAATVAKLLKLSLSRTADRTPICGIPYHEIDSATEALVAAGHRVTQAEFVE